MKGTARALNIIDIVISCMFLIFGIIMLSAAYTGVFNVVVEGKEINVPTGTLKTLGTILTVFGVARIIFAILNLIFIGLNKKVLATAAISMVIGDLLGGIGYIVWCSKDSNFMSNIKKLDAIDDKVNSIDNLDPETKILNKMNQKNLLEPKLSKKEIQEQAAEAARLKRKKEIEDIVANYKSNDVQK